MIIYLFFILNFFLSISDQGNFIPYIITLQTPFILFLFLKKKRKIKVLLPKLSLILFAYLLVNLIFSAQKQNSFEMILIYLATYLIFILSYNLKLSKKRKIKFLNLFSKFSFLLTLPYLYFRFKPITQNFSALEMIRPITGHVHISSLLILSLVTSFLLKRKFLSFWFLICLISTNSISAFLALVLFSTFLIWTSKHHTLYPKLPISILYTLYSILFVFLVFSYFQPKFLQNLDFVWQKKALFGGRQYYWTQAIKGFLSKPILGWGLDTFGIISTKFNKYSYSLYAHGFYFQVLAELGILGFILLFLLAKKIFSNLNLKSKENKIIFLVFLVSCVETAFDYGWQFPSLLFLLAFLLGMIIHHKVRDNHGCPLQIKYNKFILLPLFLVILSTTQILSLYFYRQKNYKLSLLFYPLNEKVYIQNYKNFSPKLINFMFKDNLNYWKEIEKICFKKKLIPQQIHALQKQIDLSSKTYYPSLKYKLINLYYQNNQPCLSLKTAFEQIWLNYQPENQDLFLTKNEKEILNPLIKQNCQTISNQNANLLKNGINNSRNFYTQLFYNTGLYFYKQKQLEITKLLWEKTTYLNPEWSFFHIELANLYYYIDQKDQAVNQLQNICTKYKSPKNHCQNYLKDFPYFQKPGVYKEKIRQAFSKHYVNRPATH